ncbi:hypothetical protein H2200_003626 [Cladophialophora chaetospira]|uniref:Uncharacterized protein n=1 Tax=Cladophialophora chaetospira TaxID=386627 RepID=A0AA38XF90_9EURO|nr:hypothetical protein H2200_003626 [Cladophialophora chaetospira]
MSVSPFSVQYDWEVQEYNRRRAAWKASTKAHKHAEKSLRAHAKSERATALQQIQVLGFGRKKVWSIKFLSGSRRRDGSTGSAPVVEDKFGGGYESDEITLTEALVALK